MVSMYTVQFAQVRPEMAGLWNGPAWSGAGTLRLTHFRKEGSSHHPGTGVKLLYDAGGIYGLFRVEDRYVRCLRTGYMDPVYKDSCVEFFVRPRPDSGYFNFEFNCGGALLCSYIVNPERVPGGFRDFTPLPPEDGERVIVYHSLPKVVDPEEREPILWFLEFFIPFALLEKYTGPLGDPGGRLWRANFYKCGDETSHPHWASWKPVHSLNFHLPDCFGEIRFGERQDRTARRQGLYL